MDLAQIEADLVELEKLTEKLAPTLAPKLEALVARVQAVEALLGKAGPVVSRVLTVLKTLHLV